MKILIINPNSDKKMTADIHKSAQGFAAGGYEVTCLPTPGAPKFIETYEDQAKAAPGMIKLARENAHYDAFIVACHCDPNLDVLKEICQKPVIGIGEASMKIATLLGHKFSVISTDPHSIPNKEALIHKYFLHPCLASIRAPLESQRDLPEREKFTHLAQQAIHEDMAECIVLGCAGLTGLDKYLEKILGIPVLDGVICALILASGLVRYQVSTSKIRRYNPYYQQ